jgi:PPK2 family polyphosphate:nucleotide phosphotransferase
MKLAKMVKHCRVDDPKQFRLADYDPAEDFGLAVDRDGIAAKLADGIGRLRDLQERLYAHDRWAVLIVLQGMDAAGKDSVIKHVMSGVNPQGCEVSSFKAPSEEELQHDFFWRTTRKLPARGHIGIFNRSYYEEVLVVRVHPGLLRYERLPPQFSGKRIWEDRFEEICDFERYLVRNGTLVLKFHLRLSKEEQLKRFLARLDEPGKRWKFSTADMTERERWDQYMDAFEDMIRATSTEHAPWYVVPADHKHVTWLVVSAAIVEALEGLKVDFPKVKGKQLAELMNVERMLRAEEPGEAKRKKSAKAEPKKPGKAEQKKSAKAEQKK